jgi:hypothetical protein
MEAQGERRYSSYSLMTLVLDGVSGQRHTSAALYRRGKGPPVPIGQEAGQAPELVWTQRLGDKPSCLCQRSNFYRPVVQFVTRHYTDLSYPGSQREKDLPKTQNFCFGNSLYNVKQRCRCTKQNIYSYAH